MDVPNVLTDAEVQQIIKQAIGDKHPTEVLHIEVKRASDAITGFLGDHLRMTIHVKVQEKKKVLHLFVKRVPQDNKSKADYVNNANVFAREAFVFEILDRIVVPDANPWCAKSYLKNNRIVVMPDLAVEGYSTRITKDPNDITHAFLTAEALAQFHAAFANYVTKRSIEDGKSYEILEEHAQVLKETIFCENELLNKGILLHSNFINAMSNKYSNFDFDLSPLYIKACKSVRRYDNTLNVLVHRDLWSNNIMYKYENGVPVNALLVDFQLVQYAPPAFDPMLFLYMTTTKSFRDQHEEKFLRKYFSTFIEKVDDGTKKRLADLKYDYSAFREWCEKARMFGLIGAMIICPFGLMDPTNAEKEFDGGVDDIFHSDRTKAVVEAAKQDEVYKKIMLEIFEEFIDRYVLNAEKYLTKI